MATCSSAAFALGIRDHPISPRSPWQNGYAERLIGSIRRECLDHVVVFGERRLRHVLSCYIDYYNAARTHLSLEKDTPVARAVQSIGPIQARPVLGGLHHQYARIDLRQGQGSDLGAGQIAQEAAGHTRDTARGRFAISY